MWYDSCPPYVLGVDIIKVASVAPDVNFLPLVGWEEALWDHLVDHSTHAALPQVAKIYNQPFLDQLLTTHVSSLVSCVFLLFYSKLL